MRNPRSVIAIAAGAAAAVALLALVSSAGASDSSAKALMQQQRDKERAAAVAGPRAPKNASAVVPAAGKPLRQPGILNIRQGPVAASEFLVNNEWQGPISGTGSTWYVVWAGSTGSASPVPGSPGIIVHSQTPTADGLSFADTTIGMFAEPRADGPLTIMAVSGATLELVTPSGRVFQFDLQAERFG
jgi:type II secretory pathway pseudopilin PulG